MVERIVDEHARAGVDSMVHCVLGTGFRSHIPNSKYTDLLVEFRPPKLDQAGIDYFQVVMDRCKHHKMEFIAGIRMNDRHELPPGTFIKEHSQWKLNAFNSNAMNYAFAEVRRHILDITQETLERYDVDGIEYDYMRWCHMFEPGRGKGERAPVDRNASKNPSDARRSGRKTRPRTAQVRRTRTTDAL